MAKNKLSKNFKAKPDKNTWATICPPMEYRVITGEKAYELGIVPIQKNITFGRNIFRVKWS